ncbi:MAG: pyridoxamine 5'-phosphate oxidase family protein [Gammaproteobacteria bacterium]|nr:pyridoxamine 5'-phosphate oxidase family protein [Gammaproteobacteria bacterium]
MIPKEINNYFIKQFKNKNTAIFCQVANQSNLKPHIRTMRLYAFTETGHLEFLSRTDTQKWLDWEKHPYAAVCFLNLSFGQIVAEGNVLLKTTIAHADEMRKYWDLLPKNIKMIYTDKEEDKVPSCFGIININPTFWEVLELYDEYIESKRIIYRLVGNCWKREKIKMTS